jgi:hypothetical protein
LVREVRGGGSRRDSAESYEFTLKELSRSLNVLNRTLSLKYARIHSQLNAMFLPTMERLANALKDPSIKKALAQWIQEQEKSGTTVDAAIKALSTTSNKQEVCT